MGKGGRGKPKQAAAAAKEDDDALLDAAIAENTQAKMAEKRAQVAHSVAVAQRDQRAKALTKVEICEKLNGLPAFAIVNASKQFVPLRVAGADGNGADGEVAMLWTEPLEAESALAQATRQQPDERLAIGATLSPKHNVGHPQIELEMENVLNVNLSQSFLAAQGVLAFARLP